MASDRGQAMSWFAVALDRESLAAIQEIVAASETKILAAIAAAQKQEHTDMSALTDKLAAFQADLDKAIADLKAAIAAGNPQDIAAAMTALDAMDAEVIAADPGPQTTSAKKP